ncbi:hypothetical protein KQX54_000561 [Cotesia glomerata]|uniref:Inward rectifier potassium channel C-terminal domain-containing protein n=1 Tax=Cotesia glomerata TaxID=32391 RepID=A0AAV7IBB8_COTGL|nr:hypothetical protein KQX54_000561 [Cotesia glomerata]
MKTEILTTCKSSKHIHSTLAVGRPTRGDTGRLIGMARSILQKNCLEAIFVMCIQSMTRVILQAFMLFVKEMDYHGLMFRVGDMRKNHIIEAHIRAQMIKKKYDLHNTSTVFYVKWF